VRRLCVKSGDERIELAVGSGERVDHDARGVVAH
jgi:hypothetical protein